MRISFMGRGLFVWAGIWMTLLSAVSTTQAPVTTSDFKKLPKVNKVYEIVDLGETDVDPALLVKNPKQPNLAPRINNLGQVIGNRAEGGFVKDPIAQELAPFIHDVRINFHALNERGDILVSYNRKSETPEWMIWPTPAGKNGARAPIALPEYSNGTIVLLGLTNNREVVGNVVEDGKIHTVTWDQCRGMHRIRTCTDQLIEGAALAYNNDLWVGGIFDKAGMPVPGVWMKDVGLTFMKNYRDKVAPDEDVVLADLIMAPDGTVYGTFRINYQKDPNKDTDVYYTYAWSPETNAFRVLDIGSMRINAVNSSHVVVGSMDGRAAVCWPGQKAMALSTLVKQTDPDNVWVFLEATDINDKGQVVGYGTLNGKMRVFLADVIQSGCPVECKQ